MSGQAKTAREAIDQGIAEADKDNALRSRRKPKSAKSEAGKRLREKQAKAAQEKESRKKRMNKRRMELLLEKFEFDRNVDLGQRKGNPRVVEDSTFDRKSRQERAKKRGTIKT